MIDITQVSVQQLKRAAAIKERIEALENELTSLFNASSSSRRNSDSTTASALPKRRKVSAAARAKMAKAQKARWAKVKGNAPVSQPTGKRKYTKRSVAQARIATTA